MTIHFGQKIYRDESKGTDVPAEEIKHIATYKYGGDFFFHWTCLSCGHEHFSRGYSINGSFEKCEECKDVSLLLRSDVDYTNEAVTNHTMYLRRIEDEKFRIKLLKEKESYTFDEAIKKFRTEEDHFEILHCIDNYAIVKIARYFYEKGIDYQEKKFLVEQETKEKDNG